MKKTISLILSLILVVAFTIPVSASSTEVTSFADVPTDYWAYQDIMAMVQLGLFNGTSDPDANGVATFSPERPMTRAEFIAVLVRHLFPGEQGTAGNFWWDAEMEVAVSHGLITASDFGNYAFPCSRETMAYILVNAAKIKGESLDSMDSSDIPDYVLVYIKYQDAVLQAVRAGLITGMDDAHTFSPNGTMTRAQGATVLNRLIDSSRRADTSWIGSGTSAVTPSGQVNEWGNVILDTKPKSLGNVTTDRNGYSIDEGQACGIYNWSTGQDFTRNNVKFNEGEKHPVPVAGDIVVKADGTEVKVDYYYENGKMICLRAPGCDIWTGASINADGPYISVGSLGFFANDNGVFAKSNICGELLPKNAWVIIQKNSLSPREAGSYEGQIANEWFRWEKVGSSYEWCWIGG